MAVLRAHLDLQVRGRQVLEASEHEQGLLLRLHQEMGEGPPQTGAHRVAGELLPGGIEETHGAVGIQLDQPLAHAVHQVAQAQLVFRQACPRLLQIVDLLLHHPGACDQGQPHLPHFLRGRGFGHHRAVQKPLAHVHGHLGERLQGRHEEADDELGGDEIERQDHQKKHRHLLDRLFHLLVDGPVGGNQSEAAQGRIGRADLLGEPPLQGRGVEPGGQRSEGHAVDLPAGQHDARGIAHGDRRHGGVRPQAIEIASQPLPVACRQQALDARRRQVEQPVHRHPACIHRRAHLLEQPVAGERTHGPKLDQGDGQHQPHVQGAGKTQIHGAPSTGRNRRPPAASTGSRGQPYSASTGSRWSISPVGPCSTRPSPNTSRARSQ